MFYYVKKLRQLTPAFIDTYSNTKYAIQKSPVTTKGVYIVYSNPNAMRTLICWFLCLLLRKNPELSEHDDVFKTISNNNTSTWIPRNRGYVACNQNVIYVKLSLVL